jgi:F-type H+-transporting ATPase subunit gamma
MATLRDIKRRIRSVKNIAQSTRALQLVASSKMRRAQDRVLAARPYADQLQRLLSRLALAGGLVLCSSRQIAASAARCPAT